MLTNKQRMLMAMRGERPDLIPFAPRLDLWFNANKKAGTLPEKYKHCEHYFEIALSEGWALHQINPAYQEVRQEEDNLHWALGILSYKETVFNHRFKGDIDITVEKSGEKTRISYKTPLGTVNTTVVYTEEMRKSGVSAFSIEEYAIKNIDDYGPVGYIFENLELYPDWTDFVQLQDRVGDDGVAFTMSGRAASPMHHIQKYFLDATEFFIHYRDHAKELDQLANQLTSYFDQIINIISQSPAEAVYWGANFDDMITFPSYFEKYILPWIRKAAEKLGVENKIVSCHCDGENKGLLDLIYRSGMHVAESVCPYPMTKVSIADYYQKWTDKISIFGGIPSNILLAETTSDEEFQTFVDDLFPSIAPGDRMIFGIADSTPPGAVFDRLVELGNRIKSEGKLPIKSIKVTENKQATEIKPEIGKDDFTYDYRLIEVQQDVLNGDQNKIVDDVKKLLAKSINANEILQDGMLSAMEVISGRFKDGSVFIPEVLLSARAMNAATEVLEPFLSKKDDNAKAKILIGTVHGDLHDIGKNIVTTILRGVGYEIRDLGINIKAEEFIKHVKEYKPDVLALSALLTTTMPQMKKVIEALEEMSLRNHVRVIIGGAPVNQKFADDIGADGYAADAGSSVTLVKDLFAR